MRDNRGRGVALTVVLRFARWHNLSSVKRMFDCASSFINYLHISNYGFKENQSRLENFGKLS